MLRPSRMTKFLISRPRANPDPNPGYNKPQWMSEFDNTQRCALPLRLASFYVNNQAFFSPYAWGYPLYMWWLRVKLKEVDSSPYVKQL